MPRYFIQLSYNGTNYHGWQVQENANTVQAELHQALSVVLKQPTVVCGAGRTDTGVHARMMMAHFDCEQPIENRENSMYRLNSMLPKDIAIHDLLQVRDQAHARFDALSRTYTYHLSHQKDPFLINKAYYFCHSLNLDEMNEAAGMLMEYDDFTSFSKLHSDTATNICKIVHSKWEETNAGLVYTIQADRFLRNMVRAIVGTLIEVGRGKLKATDIRTIIESKNRSNAGFSAPAHGLYLDNISYPDQLKRIGNE